MSSLTKAIPDAAIPRALAEAAGFLALYLGVLGGVIYQIAVAAGYLS